MQNLKLQRGDKVGLVASSNPILPELGVSLQKAYDFFESIGLNPVLGEHLKRSDHSGKLVDPKLRASDFNSFIEDEKIKAIINLWGGYSSHEIVELVDWNKFVERNLLLIGASDFTYLLNAVSYQYNAITYHWANAIWLGLERYSYCKDNSVHAVVIHKLDRFARSIVDHSAIRAMLMKYGTNLISCTEQLGTAPHEIFLENIMASMAQYYSDNLKTEVRKGIVERFESGYHMSVPPYGYEVRTGSKVMQIIPEEAEVVRKIFSLYVTGKYSFQTISEKLYNELNFKTRQGKKFSKGRIQDILSNVAYMGQIEYKKIGKKNQGLHKPIITPNIFLLAQDVMESRGNIRKAEKGKLDFLYKGFVACPECGKALYAAYSTGGSGKKHLYYCCRSKKHGAVNIKAKDIQKAFEKALESLQISDEVMEIVRKFVGRRLEEQELQAGKRVDECEKKVKSIEKEKLDSYKDHKKGLLDEDALRAVLSDLEDKKTLAQMELNEETIDYNDLLTQLRMLAKFGSRIDRYWEIATFDQRRDILGSMFTNVPTYENYELTNIEISPLYQALRDISENHVLSGRANTTRTCDLLHPMQAF